MYHIHPESLHHLFSHVIRLHFHRFHALLEPFGLYPGQPPLLFELQRENGLKQKELAGRLHIQPATLTVMLRRMEGTGLVERKQDADDGRVSRVYLTHKGLDACSRLKEVVQRLEKDCFQGISDPDQEQLRRLLLMIRRNLAEKGGKNPTCQANDFD